MNEAQDGMKIARRNIYNLRYTDDTTLMAESEEEMKSLLMKVKEESENVVLKLNLQKINIMASGPISSVQFSRSVGSDFLQPYFMANRWGYSENSGWLYFGGLHNHCRW